MVCLYSKLFTLLTPPIYSILEGSPIYKGMKLNIPLRDFDPCLSSVKSKHAFKPPLIVQRATIKWGSKMSFNDQRFSNQTHIMQKNQTLLFNRFSN